MLSTFCFDSRQGDRDFRDWIRCRNRSCGSLLFFGEEVGELAAAIAEGKDQANKEEEFADVLAWLATLANVEGIDLSRALHAKYGEGCPGCGKMVCVCQEKR